MWKAETVKVIPKNSAPTQLSELRNLSCTPLFSKVLESFVLSRLKDEIKLSVNQYGGVKGCSTDHFLLQTWDHIIKGLEDGDTAVNLVSIDFQKAFNRMSHHRCLEALAEFGATDTSIDWVATFLYGRTMSVRVGKSFSVPKHVPGGSPQGSILGNFLFCATTNKFAEMEQPDLGLADENSSSGSDESEYFSAEETEYVCSTPLPDRNCRRNIQRMNEEADSDSYNSSTESIRFFRFRPSNPYDTTVFEDDNTVIVETPDSTCWEPIRSLVYMDDYNCLEKLRIRGGTTHMTTGKTKVKLHAKKSEYLFDNVSKLADEKQMKVNQDKTQMLCINANKINEVESYIKKPDSNERIESTDKLKILGFTFNKEPNAVAQVATIVDKFYGRLWTLRFHKKSGMGKADLHKVYDVVKGCAQSTLL